MKIYDRKGNPISIGTVVGRGGEAIVYRVIGRPGWLAKIYEPAPRPNYMAKLTWMLDHPPANPTHALNHASLAWPTELLYGQEKDLAGYLMPYIQQAVPILVVFNPRRRVESLAQFDRRYLHRTARNLATAAGALHTSGYVVGDLNESNVLVTPSALVTLIDSDSFQVQETHGGQIVTHACPVAKPEYTPPELQDKSLSSTVRSPEQDAFGLGVLIFQLLMEGNHPFRAQWLGKGDPPPIEERIALGGFPYTSTPDMPVRPPKYAPDLNLLHPQISELIRRCFIDGHRDPRLRPDASAWERAIAEAEKNLVQCPNRHFYSEHLRACPVCHPPGASSGSEPRAAPASNTVLRGGSGYAQPTKGPAKAAKTPAASTHGSTSTPSHHTAGNPARAAKPRPGRSTSSGRSTGRAASGKPPTSPAGSATGSPYAGGVTVGFKQVQQVWETLKFWQAQQTLVQQTVPGSGLLGSRQAQQAVAAWKTWKYWQAQQAQVQQPSQAPPQATQPAQPARPTSAQPAAQAQTAPTSPGKVQSTNSSTQPTGASSAQQAQQSVTHAAQTQQKATGMGTAAPNSAQNPSVAQRQPESTSSGHAQPGLAQPPQTSAQTTPAQNAQAQSSQVQQNQPPPSGPVVQPTQPVPPTPKTTTTVPPHSQPRRTAPPYTSPQSGTAAYSRSATTPGQSSTSLLNWAGPRLYKSLAIGGGLGALAGALPGALVGVAGLSTGSMASWVLLWSLGGATAGLLRGWQPSYRMSLRVEQTVGWQRVWPIIGLLAGAALGGLFGFVLGWWAICPVFLGLLLGAWLGRKAGRKLWQAGAQLGWVRIWSVVGALSAALIGYWLAAWLGGGSLSIQLAGSFSAWIRSQSASLALVSLVIGALGGALGGAVAGTLADLSARLLNLLN
jgi:serine/threonine protein kinase